MLCGSNEGDYNETHERAGMEPGRARRSPPLGAECGPGLWASAELNILTVDFPWPTSSVAC